MNGQAVAGGVGPVASEEVRAAEHSMPYEITTPVLAKGKTQPSLMDHTPRPAVWPLRSIVAPWSFIEHDDVILIAGFTSSYEVHHLGRTVRIAPQSCHPGRG